MARSISVKVPTASVIEMIETRISEIEKQVASYPKDLADYKKAKEAYKADVLDTVTKYVKKNLGGLGYTTNDDATLWLQENYRGVMEIRIDTNSISGFPTAPIEPKLPNQREWIGRDHISRLELLEKNLRVLKITSQEEISASTYGALMEIL